jgi:hypothetical protein
MLRALQENQSSCYIIMSRHSVTFYKQVYWKDVWALHCAILMPVASSQEDRSHAVAIQDSLEMEQIVIVSVHSKLFVF